MPPYFNFIYMTEHNFLFAYVAKIACTNWKCIFRYMMGSNDYLNVKKAHDRKLSGLTFLSDIPHCKQLLESKTVKKYCFSRNPFSRVLSAYLNKVEPFVAGTAPRDDNSHFSRVFREIDSYRAQKIPEEESVNFYVFLNWILSSNSVNTKNEHWLPQSDLLQITTTNYNFIGRFENIDQDASHLLGLMECDLEFPSHENIHFPPTKASKKMNKYYSHREIRLVKKLYRQDFKRLGYPDDPATMPDAIPGPE